MHLAPSRPICLSITRTSLYRQSAVPGQRETGLFQGRGITPELNLQYAHSLAEVQREVRKPFLAVALGGLYLEQEARNVLTKAGIPVYSSAERALWAYVHLYRYGQRLKTGENR